MASCTIFGWGLTPALFRLMMLAETVYEFRTQDQKSSFSAEAWRLMFSSLVRCFSKLAAKFLSTIESASRVPRVPALLNKKFRLFIMSQAGLCKSFLLWIALPDIENTKRFSQSQVMVNKSVLGRQLKLKAKLQIQMCTINKKRTCGVICLKIECRKGITKIDLRKEATL